MGIMDDIKGRRVLDRRTICEVHRELYDHVVVELQDRPELRDKLEGLVEEAYVMGIKMSRKLREYNHNTYLEALPNDIEAVRQLRQRRIELTKGV